MKIDLLNELMSYLNDDVFLCLERIKDQSRVEDFLDNKEVSKHFHGLFRTGTGSLICTWQYKQAAKNHPIVWIDSEGTPISVIANNFRDFLALMHYGIGVIWNGAGRIENFEWFKETGRTRGTEPDEFNAEELEEYKFLEIEENKEQYNAFVKWSQMKGILPTQSPVRDIEQAIANHPKLDKWLENKGLL